MLRQTALITLMVTAASVAHAQEDKLSLLVRDAAGTEWKKLSIVESATTGDIPHVIGAPFMADAVTEFTQVLGDGNRIERRYSSSIARDGRGRTRREEDIVLVGPLFATGPAPKLVTIEDHVSGVSYTLDQVLRVAHSNPLGKFVAINRVKGQAAAGRTDPGTVTESLGRRSIEGVTAEGTRTTTTIPAGSVGNLQPMEIVSERWFSPELQMPVLISRRDPLAGETVYRLLGIVRAEPPSDLFTVPADYEIRQGKMSWKKLEMDKLLDSQKAGKRLK